MTVGAAQPISSIRKNMISRQFGEVLRQYRLARGWSQSVLSSKSKVDRTYISQIECGIHSPTITVLCRLSRALQVAPSVLVTKLERRLGESRSMRS
jgi:transcriptional regulator with XRE-family HTH domain